MSVDQPNYTQIPNVILDAIHLMPEAAMRIAFVICRQTFGYHRKRHTMSISFLCRATGMSRQGVINGTNWMMHEDRKWITRTESGQSFEYELLVGEVDQTSQRSRPVLVNEVDRLGTESGQRSRPALVNEVDQTSQLSRPKLVNEVDTNKERKKSTKENSKKSNPSDPESESASVGAAAKIDFATFVKSDSARSMRKVMRAEHMADESRERDILLKAFEAGLTAGEFAERITALRSVFDESAGGIKNWPAWWIKNMLRDLGEEAHVAMVHSARRVAA